MGCLSSHLCHAGAVGKKAPKQPSLPKTVDTEYVLTRPRKGAKLKEEVWQTENGEVGHYSLSSINHRICGVDNGRVLGYDNSHEYDHRHFMGPWSRLKSRTTEYYPGASMLKYTSCGGKKMKKKVNVLKLDTGTLDEYVKRSIDRAEKLDRNEKLPAEFRITFEDPADLLRVLSAERLRVLYAIRKRTKPTISGLAIILKRDRRAVSRDVKLLEGLGLLKTRNEANPGHGAMTVVEPLAEKYHLEATV